MKEVMIINQNKGGVGKTFLTSLLVKKYIKNKDVLIIDIDSGNRSTFKRFSNKNEITPKISEYTLLENETIDKGKFDELFSLVSKSDESTVILDLGGNESRELISLIELITPEYFEETFKSLNLKVSFLTVVRAGDTDTFDYLRRINQALNKKLALEVYINGDSYSSENDTHYQTALIFLTQANLKYSTFGKAPIGVMREKISDHVKKGFDTELGLFKGLFVRMVDDLNVGSHA